MRPFPPGLREGVTVRGRLSWRAMEAERGATSGVFHFAARSRCSSRRAPASETQQHGLLREERQFVAGRAGTRQATRLVSNADQAKEILHVTIKI